ncbi:hypothetical protein NFI96_012016 [Prochilodus magdalenae]|nr:hypothetical protein NFI96_012016 [Prochilodus magdalenae]
MEVICVTVLLLLLLCRVEVTPVPTENFRAGDTVDLSCNKNHRDRTMWYGQKNNRAPFIIISAEMTLKHSEHPSMKFYWGYNSRINVTWNRTNNSIGLTIKNINESDEGFYFCTVGDGIFTTPGSGHILTLEVLCRVKFTPVPTENTLLRYQTTTQSIRNFRAGDTVDLSCNKNHRDRTMWYGQKNNRAPFIIISAEMTLKHSEHPSMKFYWGYNSRINVTWNRTNNSVGLTIKNINESDEGFYFCTVGDGIFTTPGSGHILTLEGKYNNTIFLPCF